MVAVCVTGFINPCCIPGPMIIARIHADKTVARIEAARPYMYIYNI